MRFKRILIVALAVCVAMGLAFGCAKKKPAVKAPITVGGIFDITGPTSAVGKDYAQAAKDAERYINESGGIDGRTLKLIANDYAYKIPEALNLYKQYRDVNKVFCIQGWGTGDTNALKEQISKDKIVYISASYDSALTDPTKTPFNFFVGTSYSDSIRVALKFVKDQGCEKFVFIYPDHPYGKAPIPAGKAIAKDLGIKVGPDEIVGLRAISATTQLLHMKEFDPEWAWLGGTTPSCAVVVKDAAKLGLKTKFISNLWGFDENTLKMAGDAANDRIYSTNPFTFYGLDVPGMKTILDLNKKYSPDAKHTVRYVQGWSAMMVMWEGLKRAAKAGQLNGPGLKAGLESLKDFSTGGLTPPITFTPTDHRPSMGVSVYKISGGKIVKVTSTSLPRKAEWLGW